MSVYILAAEGKEKNSILETDCDTADLGSSGYSLFPTRGCLTVSTDEVKVSIIPRILIIMYEQVLLLLNVMLYL